MFSETAARSRVVGFLCVVLLAVASGCANPASFQTPDTLDAGEQREGGGLTYTTYEVLDSDGEATTMNIPAFVGWARYGLVDRLEVRALGWVPFGGKVGAKFEYMGYEGNPGPQLAFGGDVGYSGVPVDGDLGSLTHAIDIYVPVYGGFRFTEAVSAYLTPQYVFRVASGDDVGGVGHMGTATLGAAFGTSTRFYVEASAGYDTLWSTPIFGVGAGLEVSVVGN